MSLLRQPIERKLSAVIGAEVTFEKLKVSLLGGSLEASGVTIAGDDPTAPLLTVRRVRAEISVAKALAKQFVVKSLTIEGPVISMIRRQDGSSNLPRRPADDPVSQPPEPEESIPDESAKPKPDEEPASWRLETQRVSLTDGQIQFRDQTDGSVYYASAEQISAELRQIDDKVTFTITIPSAGRRDREILIGPIQIKGSFTDITDLAKLAKSAMEAKVEVAGGIIADVTTTALDGGDSTASVQAPLNLAEWISAMPPSLHLPGMLTSPGFTGRANISLKLRHDSSTGIRVQEFVLRVSEATIPLPARASQ